jgi:hypothetical protein
MSAGGALARAQTQVLRRLSDRGMDKALSERMLEVRRYYLPRAIAHAGLIEYRIATRLERSEKAAELENNLA